MKLFPYTTLNKYPLDHTLYWKALDFYKNKNYGVFYRNNNNTESNVTTLYAHEDFITDYKDLIDYKRKTLDIVAKKFLDEFKLDIDYSVCIMITKKDCILKWHTDQGGIKGTQAAVMMNFNSNQRAPTSFKYNNQNFELTNYKCAVINTRTLHQVDNTGYDERHNIRISLYGPTFEEIRDKINYVKEKNIGKYD